MFKKLSDAIDKKVFIISGLICIIFVAWSAITPTNAQAVLGSLLTLLSTDFGWLYLLVVAAFIIFLLWLAFSKYGNIRLGKDSEKPAYKYSSWFYMLFAAGMGIGLSFWSVAEPMTHYLSPPIGEGRTVEAAQNAMAITFLHWGIHPWACYAVIGLILAYFQYRRNKPGLLSYCLAPLLGEKRANGTIGSIVNILALIVTIFGVATSLGMGAMQINSGLNYVFGIPYNTLTTIIIILITSVAFIISAVVGIDKGIKTLSDINIVLTVGIMLFVFLAGSTVFLLNYFSESIGNYLSMIIQKSFWTDTFSQAPGWLGGWTVFYWAWWIAWGPFVGGFIARISRGRTIREFIAGTLLFPAVLSLFFITVMGGSAIQLDMSGVTAIAEAVKSDVAFSLFALLKQYPFTTFFSIFSVIMIAIFFVNSADSATLVCSMMTTKGVPDPPRPVIVFWGVIQCAVAVVLLIAGGLVALQTASIVAAFPFIFVCLGMMVSFIKALHEDFDRNGVPREAPESLNEGPTLPAASESVDMLAL
ncbi:MAG: BCCT family transporter [Actinobacteria bacterium]|nr:BCCT family transporter [Actinomycetota bacterium]